MSTMLKNWGCRFEIAGDGETALELLKSAERVNDPFRIALLDQMLPGMDGVELGSQIKGDSKINSTVVFFVEFVCPPVYPLV